MEYVFKEAWGSNDGQNCIAVIYVRKTGREASENKKIAEKMKTTLL